MRVLFDTNVILDLLLARQPFVTDAARLFGIAERREIDGFLCATTTTTIYYLLSKAAGDGIARSSIERLLRFLDIAPVNRAVLDSALALVFADFEDAVLHEAARSAGVDAIVTRNGQDFRQATLPVYAPVALLAALTTGNDQ